MKWVYNANDYDLDAGNYELIPEGPHRVRIETVEEAVSRTGYEMLKFTLAVSGYSGKLWYYLVFMEDRPEITNSSLGAIYDSFGITPGDMGWQSWPGRVGAARVKHEEFRGEITAKIGRLIPRARQENLPPWTESGGKKGGAGREDFGSVRDQLPEPEDGDEVDLPF